jgi:hypothetical protein
MVLKLACMYNHPNKMLAGNLKCVKYVFMKCIQCLWCMQVMRNKQNMWTLPLCSGVVRANPHALVSANNYWLRSLSSDDEFQVSKALRNELNMIDHNQNRQNDIWRKDKVCRIWSVCIICTVCTRCTIFQFLSWSDSHGSFGVDWYYLVHC